MQSKKESHYEIMANQIIGIITGWCVVYFIYPLLLPLGIFWTANISSGIFLVLSYTRMYLVRRYFNYRYKLNKLKENNATSVIN